MRSSPWRKQNSNRRFIPHLSIHQNLLVWTGGREGVVILPDAAAAVLLTEIPWFRK